MRICKLEFELNNLLEVNLLVKIHANIELNFFLEAKILSLEPCIGKKHRPVMKPPHS